MLLRKCSSFLTDLLTQLQKKKKRWHVKNHYTFATSYYPQKDQYNYKDDFEIAEGE